MIEIECETADEIFIQIAQQLIYNGKKISPRDLETMELREVYITLTDPTQNIVSLPERNMSMKYLEGERRWYESGSLNIKDIVKYSSFWNAIADKNGMINSNYGNIVNFQQCPTGKSQFEWCVEKIKEDPYTRQAVINYNQVKHKYENNKDFPCTLFQFFRVRDNMFIDCTVGMRSNDLIYGLTYDLPWFTSVQMKLCEETGYKIGNYHHYVSSLHVYKKHYPMLRKIAEPSIMKNELVSLKIFNNKLRNLKKLKEYITNQTFPITDPKLYGGDHVGWDSIILDNDVEELWFYIALRISNNKNILVYAKKDGFYMRVQNMKTLQSVTHKVDLLEVACVVRSNEIKKCLSVYES